MCREFRRSRETRTLPNSRENLYCGLEGGENPAVRSSGVLARQPSWEGHHPSWFYPGMIARRRQHRAANRRYQQSPEGRLDHRDRQQQYRERRCRPRVTDQSSRSVISPAPFGCGETITMPAVVALRVSSPGRPADLWLRCSICGRPGRFVDPFPHIPRRR